jgi:hypothetical protein
MSDDSTTQCLLFPGIFRKPIVAQFDQRDGSSDGGALLLKAADRRYGLLDELTACRRDQRQAGKVDHSLRELLAQRVFSIACGYPDQLGEESAGEIKPDQARVTPYASKTSRSVTTPSNLCTSARFTTGRISIWFAPMRSSAKSSP